MTISTYVQHVLHKPVSMSLPPKPFKADQQTDGKTNVLGKRLTPEAGLEALQNAKKAGRLACWAHLHPQLHPVDAKDPSKGQKVVLHCDQCNKDLAPSNVSQLSSSHFDKDGNCKASHGKTAGKRVSSAASSTSRSSAAAPTALSKFIVTKAQQEQALDSLTKYLVTRGCPSHIADPYLIEAFAALGCPLISESRFVAGGTHCAAATSARQI